MKIKDRKGFTIPELLMTLLIVGVMSVLLTQILTFNVSTSRAFALYSNQQYTVQDALTRLNKDIEAAVDVSIDDYISDNKYATIKLTTDGITRTWNLFGGTLSLNSTPIVTNLTSDSCFIQESNTLTVVLQPKPTNTGKNPLNVPKPIVTQFSLKYK